MKRVFAFSMILMLLFAVSSVSAAAAEAASVDIWVDIKNGGTAVIITEVNCPLPDKSSLTLDDGQSEAFHITYFEEGVYSYQIRIEPDNRAIYFDDTVYTVKVFVTESDGKLYTSIVIFNQKTGDKYAPQGGGTDKPCSVSFVNSSESPATEAPTAPASPTSPDETRSPSDPDGGDSPGGSHQPRTGDDSKLNFYLLLAILAAAGLFTLSVFYYRSVMKEIKHNNS